MVVTPYVLYIYEYCVNGIRDDFFSFEKGLAFL